MQKTSSIKLFIAFLLFGFFILISTLDSERPLFYVLMDFKMIFLMCAFLIGYNYSYKKNVDIVGVSKIVSCVTAALVILGYIGLYNINTDGFARADIGTILVPCLVVLLYGHAKKQVGSFLILVNVIATILPYGRTAILASIVIITIYFIKQIFENYRRIVDFVFIRKESIAFVAFFVSLTAFGLAVFIDRSDISFAEIIDIFRNAESPGQLTENVTEARLLAIPLFVQVLENSTLTDLFFGHGYGCDYSHLFYLNQDKDTAAHIISEQTSGFGRYNSWAFHNAIIRNVVMFGILGSALFYGFLFMTIYDLKSKTPQIREIKFMAFVFLVAQILLSFGHGIYGVTIGGCTIFMISGLIYGHGIRLVHRHKMRLNIQSNEYA